MKKRLWIFVVLLLLLAGAGFGVLLHTAQSGQGVAGSGQTTTEETTSSWTGPVAVASSAVVDASDAKQASGHIFAHRGVAGETLEHSFEAYDRAIAEGAYWIEQDIVISRDGTLYVSHDVTPERMTGEKTPFAELTDRQIDRLKTKEGHKTLKLSQVFEHYGPSVGYVIELKTSDRSTVEAFRRTVKASGLEDRIIVQCFDAKALEALEETWPDMQKLYLTETQRDFEKGLDLDYVDIISVEKSLMTRDNCRAAHEKGKQFSAWTLLGEKQIRRAIDLGVDSYFTDNVQAAVELEKDYGLKERTRPSATLFFASDYQIEEGWPEPKENLTRILKAAVKDGKDPDQVIYCGDYTNDRVLFNHQLSPEESIGEIRDVIASQCPHAKDDASLFVQGNHDRKTASIAASGLHEYDDYLIYVVNTENDFPWSQGKNPQSRPKVERTAADMKACFDKLIKDGENRPVFIAGHVPLHFTARTSSRHTTGDNLYAGLIFDVCNEAGKDLDIIYLFGHNHSKGWDCYLGGSCVYKAAGDELLVPDAEGKTKNTDVFSRETLQFTYLNAGYTGYFMNCGPKEADKGIADQFKAADDTLTGTVCQIYEDKIVLTRYSKDGVHPLGSDGEGNPYKDHIDRDLIDPADYAKEVKSPQQIKR